MRELRWVRFALPVLLVLATLAIELTKGADVVSLSVAVLAAFCLGLMLSLLLRGFALLVRHESAGEVSKRQRQRALATDLQQLERSLGGLEFDARMKRFSAADAEAIQAPLRRHVEELRVQLEALERSSEDGLESEVEEELRQRMARRARADASRGAA